MKLSAKKKGGGRGGEKKKYGLREGHLASGGWRRRSVGDGLRGAGFGPWVAQRMRSTQGRNKATRSRVRRCRRLTHGDDGNALRFDWAGTALSRSATMRRGRPPLFEISNGGKVPLPLFAELLYIRHSPKSWRDSL